MPAAKSGLAMVTVTVAEEGRSVGTAARDRNPGGVGTGGEEKDTGRAGDGSAFQASGPPGTRALGVPMRGLGPESGTVYDGRMSGWVDG
jgi:hypothetical protein